jgi:hypothetical protein
MTIEVRYLDDGKGAIYEASGVLRGEELIEANERVLSRALAGESLLYSFFDCNSITGVAISDTQLRLVADRAVAASRRMPNHVIVAIYAKDDIPFALSRMWMVYVEAAGWKTDVFRRKSQAVAWLKEQVAIEFGVAISLNALDAQLGVA